MELEPIKIPAEPFDTSVATSSKLRLKIASSQSESDRRATPRLHASVKRILNCRLTHGAVTPPRAGPAGARQLRHYISQDPLGVVGGLELYGYCKDPLTWVDPLGLCGENASGAGPQNATNNLKNLNSSEQRSVRSLQQRRTEHREKLDAFRHNPDLFDNKGFLRNAPSSEVRQRIIDGCIRHLENEISNFEQQIQKLLGGG